MSFPFIRAADAEAASFMNALEKAAILVVDDMDVMRRITASQLRGMGVKRVLEAANGAEALKLLSTDPFTMVISDWNMPVMSGLDLLLAMKADPRYASMPFMMITAEAERDRVQTAINAGVNELLVKPYTAGLLSERLERCLLRKGRAPLPQQAADAAAESQASAAPAASGAHGQPLPPSPVFTPAPVAAIAPVPASAPLRARASERPTILVVDDTPDNLHLLTHLFKDEYRVKISHNGPKAIAMCQSETPPDLVLLDIMMPDIDGFEVAKALRNHPTSEHLPVIFVTSLTDEDSRLRGLELGAVDFVSKPIAPELLRLRVRNFMRYINLQRQLQDSYDAMLEAARLREQVEQMTRHDMKAPLAGVIGLAQGLLDVPGLKAEQSEQLRLLEETALQVLGMINLSSEIYKIETGRFTLKPQPVAVGRILERLTAIANRTFSAKDVTITLTATEELNSPELNASGDAMFCYSVFQNLLKNACEAAPNGSSVAIIVTASPDLRISIANSGAVPAAVRDTFFEKFATAGKSNGTGLGTYSARLLTEAQGGSIAMETSDTLNSTTLTVTLLAFAVPPR